MPYPAGCGHYAPNRDYAADAVAIKTQREEEHTALQMKCDMCSTKGIELVLYGIELAYWGCRDLIACEKRRAAYMKRNYKEM